VVRTRRSKGRVDAFRGSEGRMSEASILSRVNLCVAIRRSEEAREGHTHLSRHNGQPSKWELGISSSERQWNTTR